MAKVTISEAKSIISEIDKKSRSKSPLLMPTRSGPSAKATKERARLLSQFFTKGGLDLDRIDKITKEDKPRSPAKSGSELTKEYNWRKNSLLEKAKQISAIQPLLNTVNHQVLNIQPLLIFANHAGALLNSNIGLNDNWAKAYLDTTTNSPSSGGGPGVDVSFLYLWENASDGPAYVDIDTYLGLYGECTAHSAGGHFPGDRFCNLSVGAVMAIYQSWEKPPLPTVWYSNGVEALNLFVDTGGFFSSSRSLTQSILTFPHLEFTGLLVPAGDTAVFQVMATLGAMQESGEATFDFNQRDWTLS